MKYMKNTDGIVVSRRDRHLILGVYVDAKGYPSITWKGKTKRIHRIIMGASNRQQVDHKDGNKLNCRRSNLRVATHAQNLWNRGKTKNNKSGYKGVYLCSTTGRWRAEIRANNKVTKIGRFNSKKAAAQAYDAKAREFHGEFAKLNFSGVTS